MQKQSTLQMAHVWVKVYPNAARLLKPMWTYRIAEDAELNGVMHFFAGHIVFDKEAGPKKGR